MKVKSVAFNMADPDQVKLFKHAGKRPNFSGYVKRLIQRDMEGVPVPTREEPEPEKELMEGLI